MAKISDIIFCSNAQNIDGVGVSANNILTVINPEYVPGLFSFSVVVTTLDLDCSISHELFVEFLDPTDESVIEINVPVPVVEDNSNLPKEYKGLNLAMDWNNVNFKRSGVYKIKIRIDDELIGEKSIFVKGKNE